MAGRIVLGLLFAAFLATIGPAEADELSGTFVGAGSDGVFLIQMVRSADGALTGRYEQIVLQTTGELTDTNAGITGASDGRTVVITVKPNTLFSGSLSVSGTFDGQILHLRGGSKSGVFAMDLTKGDEAAFQAQVAKLKEQADQIRQAQADAEKAGKMAKALADLKRLAQRLSDFGPYADAHFSKFDPAEQKYRDITADMRKALAKQKKMVGGYDAGIARSDISIWIGDAQNAASQMHDGVENARAGFERTTGSILTDTQTYDQACSAIASLTASDGAGIDLDAWQSACATFQQGKVPFLDRVASIRRSFLHIAVVWDEENAKQLAIVQASNAAQ